MADTKPTCQMTGEDGNVFNLIGIAKRALKEAGLTDQAKEMQTKVMKAGSYDNALAIMSEYVDIE